MLCVTGWRGGDSGVVGGADSRVVGGEGGEGGVVAGVGKALFLGGIVNFPGSLSKNVKPVRFNCWCWWAYGMMGLAGYSGGIQSQELSVS